MATERALSSFSLSGLLLTPLSFRMVLDGFSSTSVAIELMRNTRMLSPNSIRKGLQEIIC